MKLFMRSREIFKYYYYVCIRIMTRKKLTLSVDEKILKKYKDYAKKEGINISRRVEKYLKKDMKIR